MTIITEPDLFEWMEEAHLLHGKDAPALMAFVVERVRARDAENADNILAAVQTAILHFTGYLVPVPDPSEPLALAGTEAPMPPGCEPCQVCGRPLRVGEWGCISRVVDHAPSVQTHPFVAYFDVALGREVTSLGDRWQAMKAEPPDEYTEGRPKLEYRDKMSKGELSARRDRLEQRKREEARR